MKRISRRQVGFLALSSISLATLAACGSNNSANNQTATSDNGGSTENTTENTEVSSLEVQDARGTVTVPVPAERIAATDNRIFRTLEDWGLSLVAAPIPLIPAESAYKNDSSILDTGSHREPDLEKFVAANPDLVLNGQRYADYYEDIKALVPNAAVVDTDIDLNKGLQTELTRQITLLGQALQQEAKAQELVDELDKAISRVSAAYDPSQKVMGLITTGGNINYSAPVTGRAIGPLYPLLNLTPAIEVEGTTDHQGDDISVEAVADSNPDWIIVMDRDAAVSASQEAGYQPAAELVAESEALKNVTAVIERNVVYMPNNFYVTEDIQAYTEFLNTFADALEAKA